MTGFPCRSLNSNGGVTAGIWKLLTSCLLRKPLHSYFGRTDQSLTVRTCRLEPVMLQQPAESYFRKAGPNLTLLWKNASNTNMKLIKRTQ